jgi:hypothetical protein
MTESWICIAATTFSNKYRYRVPVNDTQCCRSGMFLPDPDLNNSLSRIPEFKLVYFLLLTMLSVAKF